MVNALMSDRFGIPAVMNKLPRAKRIAVLSALVEGCSVASVTRMTGVAKRSVLNLLVDLAMVCAAYMDANLRNLKCKRVQVDELWSFVGKKQKRATDADKACGKGDAWVWLGIDADSKLIVSYLVGQRDSDHAEAFITDLASRLANKIQLTSDGLRLYVDAVENAFGADVDYAQLVKQYTNTVEGEKRYSPAQCCGAVKTPVTGRPAMEHVSTSYSERLNLTVRMQDRRFTRLTNAFSKKIDNHTASTIIHVMWYNFVRRHATLRVSPAMEAGVTDHLWSLGEIVDLLEKHEAQEAAAQIKPSGLTPVRRRSEMVGQAK